MIYCFGDQWRKASPPDSFSLLKFARDLVFMTVQQRFRGFPRALLIPPNLLNSNTVRMDPPMVLITFMLVVR